MKKKLGFLVLALAAMFVFQTSAMAVTYTVTSEERYTDAFGNSKKDVVGTIAFDSDYPCNLTTARCGEDLLPSQLGFTSINYMAIEPGILPHAGTDNPSGGAFIFKYHADGVSGSGGTAGNIRAYYYDNTGLGPLASAPTYDLSTMASVPFRAVGSI